MKNILIFGSIISICLALALPYTYANEMSFNPYYTSYLDPSSLLEQTNQAAQEFISVPRIIAQDINMHVNEQLHFSSYLMIGTGYIMDAECELDIYNKENNKIIDFRSLYTNQDGLYTFTDWTPINADTYILAQYCWHGEVLGLNKIYENSTIIVS
jgi:hypothetical protein